MEETKKKNEKRVGTYTFGAMLIIIGISVIIMTFTKFDALKYILMLWPVVLIGLGIEILYLNSKKDIKIKVDFISIVLMCIVLFFTAIFSVGNYIINKVLYDDNVKSIVLNRYFDKSYYATLDENVTIKVQNEEQVNVYFVKANYTEGKSQIRIEFKFDVNEANMLQISEDNREIYQNIIDYEKSQINIKDVPEYLKKINILIYTNDINNINYEGKIVNEN